MGYPIPDFVITEFEEYLLRGIRAHGFLRAQSTSCQHDMLGAFNRKKNASAQAAEQGTCQRLWRI
jgi:hypothetical protein